MSPPKELGAKSRSIVLKLLVDVDFSKIGLEAEVTLCPLSSVSDDDRTDTVPREPAAVVSVAFVRIVVGRFLGSRDDEADDAKVSVQDDAFVVPVSLDPREAASYAVCW